MCVTCNALVAERVSKRRHRLESKELKVERLVACPPPPIISADVDELKLLFTSLPVSANCKDAAAAAAADDDEQKLKEFVQAAAGAEIQHVTYSSERDKAVIAFQSTPRESALKHVNLV